jgi:hypothetical protein
LNFIQGKPQRNDADRKAADTSEVRPLMNDDIDDEFSRSDEAEIGTVGTASAVREDKLDTTNHLIDLYPTKS